MRRVHTNHSGKSADVRHHFLVVILVGRVPITRSRLTNDKHGEGAADHWWYGTAKEEWKGRHLGIAQTPRYKFPHHNNNLIHVMNEGWDGYAGSGSGHKVNANDKQHYCWKGKEIPKTEFGVAVSPAR